jgi:hypothetical protein
MAFENECNQKRTDILTLAKNLASDGAHYLWSAGGDKPTADGPVYFAPVVLDAGKLEQTSFCAAAIDSQGFTYVCAGRFQHPGLQSEKPSKKIAVLPGVSANGDDASIKLLQDFIQKYSKLPGTQVGWAAGLTPRVIQGQKVMNYLTVPATNLAGALVWGEGCDDTLHFDCGGFIRYVVRKVCNISISGMSDDPGKKNHHGEAMGELVNEGDLMLPADILVYPGHIAFATETNQFHPYNPHGEYEVAQAESAAFGVNVKRRKKISTKCIRLSASTLLNRKTTGT